MWFSLIFLKSRDVQRWRLTSKQRLSCKSGILLGTFPNQPEVSTTSGSKVMADYVIFTKVVTLTLIFIRFSPKNLPGSLELSTSAVKISERLNQWCGLYIVQLRTDRQTNKQTDRQTNRGDQYTLQKSTILQSNKPRWPIYFAKIYDFAK